MRQGGTEKGMIVVDRIRTKSTDAWRRRFVRGGMKTLWFVADVRVMEVQSGVKESSLRVFENRDAGRGGKLYRT